MGLFEGNTDGVIVGCIEGLVDGKIDGDIVFGELVGCDDGSIVDSDDWSSVGLSDGKSEGDIVGVCVG